MVGSRAAKSLAINVFSYPERPGPGGMAPLGQPPIHSGLTIRA